jgi:tyrosinase
MATHFEHVQQILANAAAGAFPNHDGNGRFWELALDDFQALTIYGVQLIADPGPNRGRDSGLVRALRGESPFDGTLFQRMPLGRPPVSPADIQFIEDWIDADLPNEEIGDAPDNGTPDEPETGRPPTPPSSYRERYKPPSPPKGGYLIKNCNLVREAGNNLKIRQFEHSATIQEVSAWQADFSPD